jgi:3-oxoacyl-[acyl-carrier protein] reductase
VQQGDRPCGLGTARKNTEQNAHKGKVSIITGAGQGIGRETAIKFAKEEPRSPLRHQRRRSRATKLITDAGRIRPLSHRYRQEDHCQNGQGVMANGPDRHPGQQRKHRSDAQFKMTDEQFERVIGVNLKNSQLHQAVVDIMLEQNSGCILNAFRSSASTATSARPITRRPSSASSAWSRRGRATGPQGIRANAICQPSAPILAAMWQIIKMMEDRVPLGRSVNREIGNTYAWLRRTGELYQRRRHRSLRRRDALIAPTALRRDEPHRRLAPPVASILRRPLKQGSIADGPEVAPMPRAYVVTRDGIRG